MLSKRSYEPELLDLGATHYTAAEYRDCMDQLDRIARFLGGNRATFKALDKLPFIPESILDVGCGSGHFTMHLAARYPNAKIAGVDISDEAIEIARGNQLQAQKTPPNVSFFSSYLHEVPHNSMLSRRH